jgi:hypothetical protein
MSALPNTNYFLAFWCSEGFESIEDITEFADWDTYQAFERMAGNDVNTNPINQRIKYYELRARFNGQRNYELYGFRADDSITSEDLWEMAEADPQGTAELIRERGVKIYSDRRTTAQQIT